MSNLAAWSEPMPQKSMVLDGWGDPNRDIKYMNVSEVWKKYEESVGPGTCWLSVEPLQNVCHAAGLHHRSVIPQKRP